jgi:gluconokinase
MSKYVIGLDIGTTSAKAVVFNKSGDTIAESEKEYPLIKPRTNWAEQDPNIIEAAAVHAMKQALALKQISKNELIAIGMSSAMHSLICLDNDGQPLSKSIIWADGRSEHQASELKRANEGMDIYLSTGTPIHPMSPLLKLRWMRENKFEPYLKGSRFVSIKEYLLFKWFNKFVVDYSVAASSGLFNIHTLDWDEKALQYAGVNRDQLSTIVDPITPLIGMKQEVADEIGVSSTLPLIIGASDGPLANLGIGAINKGEAAVTIGTSGAIRQMTSSPKTDEKQEIFCYSFLKDLWVMGGPTNNGGIALQWLKEVIGNDEKDFYETVMKKAGRVRPGSEKLLFMPYLNGERAPFWDATAKGGFIGLTMGHSKEHMMRSVLEGVIFSIYHVGEALNKLAGEPERIYASGGFARSPLWLQILADVFGAKVEVPMSHQSSAWGAAWLALYSVGEVESLDEIKSKIPMKEIVVPNADNHYEYQKLFSIYRDLYVQLSGTFRKLSELG